MQKFSPIKRIITLVVAFFLFVNLLVLVSLAQPAIQKNAGTYLKVWLGNPQTPQPLTTPFSAAQVLSSTPLPTPTYSTAWQDGLGKQGTVILSMRDGVNDHLFAYHPLYLPLTRLTSNNWDDITPSISPDGKNIAYASHRNGYWDIYILNIETNQTTQFTDTPDYDGAPTWSPDGQWIAYESYLDNNLEILIKSVNNPGQAPIRLTNSPGIDSSPNWSPLGRDIAFISDRSGEPEIWIAHLDQTDNRFVQVSNNPDGNDISPRWSPDGTRLAWVSGNEEQNEIVVKNFQNSAQSLKVLGAGNMFTWSPLGDMLLTTISAANQTNLGSYLAANGQIFYPPITLPGNLKGLDWKTGSFPLWIDNKIKKDPSLQKPAVPLWAPANSLSQQPPAGRSAVVAIANLTAPYPYLHDNVDEGYNALRIDLHKQIGWNFLDSLESAFQPLTEPPPPQMEVNWLLTGRAFAFNRTPYDANWMVVTRENISGQIYWHVFLRTRYQDGSQGQPMNQAPWNFSARFTGDPEAYEKGGTQGIVPAGYWVDFTDLAISYGWKRLPALPTWRAFFEASRFNQFYMDGGLTWEQAMENIYPPEALMTQTYVPSRTVTITPTFKNFTPSTPTLTATITLTPTLHPTWTPLPE
jgi:TolB protein